MLPQLEGPSRKKVAENPLALPFRRGARQRPVGLLGEFVGHQTRRSHSQDEEGDLTVFLVSARHIEVRELGLGPRGGSSVLPVTRVLADCGVDIAEGLDCVVLAAKLFVYPIEAFSPPPRPFCLDSL